MTPASQARTTGVGFDAALAMKRCAVNRSTGHLTFASIAREARIAATAQLACQIATASSIPATGICICLIAR